MFVTFSTARQIIRKTAEAREYACLVVNEDRSLAVPWGPSRERGLVIGFGAAGDGVMVHVSCGMKVQIMSTYLLEHYLEVA